MIRPSSSSLRNSSQLAQSPTRLEFAISTRGAQAWVRITPTGLPDCTSNVSSSSRSRRLARIASYAGQVRAALPVPPYTTSSSGRSATSGSRLFISIRSGASVCQLPAVSSVPVAARTVRLVELLMGSPSGWSVTGKGSVERADRVLDGGDERPRTDVLDGMLDLGGEVAVGAGPLDVATQQRERRARRRRGGERGTEVQGTRGGEVLDRHHPREPVDGAPEL